MKKNKHPLYIFLFIVYIVLLLRFLLFNNGWNAVKDGFLNMSIKNLWQQLSNTQWMPFELIIKGYKSQTMETFFTNLGKIMLWLIPLGFFMPKLTKHRSGTKVLIIGMTLGLLVEIFGFLAYHQILRIDAIILAGFGAYVGYGIFKSL
jgi:glycopeptide antibiotics resistance protein